jgi:hypothetical protein
MSVAVLLNLPEDPRIRRGGPSNHHRIAARLRDHGAGVFGRTNIAVADHRNLHGIFHRGDPLPAGLAAVALFAGTGVKADRC